ncbi:MAG: hypothetical protein PHV20_00585 [Bacteroidales bacterium]|nr:hypothetical protein [Bacteroidales bacterium]
MSTEELKLAIFREVDSLDGSKLKELYGILKNFVNSQNNEEEWDNLLEAEKEGIEAALQQLNDGEAIYHSSVISQAREKYENK